MNSLRASVLEQFNATPRGGDEITGVLFGVRGGDEVRIQACCAGESNGNLQFSDSLTETQRAITAVVAAARDRKELEGMEPLGWFRAHPRAQLVLTPRDLDIANALFPHLWQVGLVMRPANSAATRVAFYFRDREVPWTADCTVREFTLPPAELSGPPSLPPPAEELEPMAMVQQGPPSHMSALLSPPEEPTSRRVPFTAIAVVALALVGAGAYYYFYGMGSPALSLSVQATDSTSQMRITWDRTSRPVRNARAGYIEIADGGQNEHVDLPAGQLQIGYVNHPRQSNQVAVRMVVITDDGSTEDVARFTAPVAPPLVTETAQAVPQTTPPDAAALEPPGAGPSEKIPELVVVVPVETDAVPERPAAERPKFQPPPSSRPVRAPAMEEAPAPPITAPQQSAHSAPGALVPTPAVHTEPPPEKPATRPAAAPAQSLIHRPALPAAGRVIWIGFLQKGQPVRITGKTSSTGTLIGELPTRPFRYSISPGDLTSDGIVLYSSNMQYANSVVEPPSAQNGWNKTVYTWNPKFATDVAIDETPAAQNGWSRMVLHSKSRKISVIVIDWTALN